MISILQNVYLQVLASCIGQGKTLAYHMPFVNILPSRIHAAKQSIHLQIKNRSSFPGHALFCNHSCHQSFKTPGLALCNNSYCQITYTCKN